MLSVIESPSKLKWAFTVMTTKMKIVFLHLRRILVREKMHKHWFVNAKLPITMSQAPEIRKLFKNVVVCLFFLFNSVSLLSPVFKITWNSSTCHRKFCYDFFFLSAGLRWF